MRPLTTVKNNLKKSELSPINGIIRYNKKENNILKAKRPLLAGSQTNLPGESISLDRNLFHSVFKYQ